MKLIESGITIGAKRIIRFNPITTDKIKINLKAREEKSISLIKIGAYKLSEDFEL